MNVREELVDKFECRAIDLELSPKENNDRRKVWRRILSKLSFDPETGCIFWQGGTNDQGYGYIRYQNKSYRVHRLVYELLVGPIEDGKLLLHSCHNRNCVCVEHLRQGSQKENMEDLAKSGRRNGWAWVTSEQKLKFVKLLDSRESRQWLESPECPYSLRTIQRWKTEFKRQA